MLITILKRTIMTDSEKQMKLIIAGGGTAGWLTASYFSKNFPEKQIILIEDPNTPPVGVGESVTPHVKEFILGLGIDEEEWMRETGAIHKLANRFLDWKYDGHSEYFSFTYPYDESYIMTDRGYPNSLAGYTSETATNTLDAFVLLWNKGLLNKFDKFFNPQYHYMENLTYHENNLKQPFSVSHHIDADKTAGYLKDKVAIPNGVKHLHDKIQKVNYQNQRIDSLELGSGDIVRGDYYFDCTGFARVLTKNLNLSSLKYIYPIDSCRVARTDYKDKAIECTNYTQTKAKSEGWQFGVTLNKRQGNGYCFSSSLSDDKKVENEFIEETGKEGRLLSWTPERLREPCFGNIISIGLASGFIEPLEANSLYITIRSIRLAEDFVNNFILYGKEQHESFNKKICSSLDDIKDFLIVHYSCANRHDSEFWAQMSELGRTEHHKDLVLSKINDSFNSMNSAFKNNTLFPNYMWMQFALSWGISVPTPKKPFKYKVENYFNFFHRSNEKHKLASLHSSKYHDYLESVCEKGKYQ